MKENMFKRNLTEDQENLIKTIKLGNNSLLINFQEFWKERCNNTEHLYSGQIYSVLSLFATNVFLKEDWINYLHKIDMRLFNGKIIDSDEMNQILLEVIDGMQIYYDKAIINHCTHMAFPNIETTAKYYNKSEV